MNRVLCSLLVLACVIGWASSPVDAQDDLQATIDALETRVAELENPKIEATPDLVEAGLSTFPGVYGEVPPTLPAAPEGAINVVLEGPFSTSSGDYRTVIIHNNSSEDVLISDVRGVVSEEDGALVGASTGAYLTEYELPTGSYTIGFVVFGSDIADTEQIKYEVLLGSESQGISSFQVTLRIQQLSQQESTFVGEVVNIHEREVEIDIIRAYCFNSDGLPFDTETSWLVSETLQPGDSLIFETEDLGSDLVNDCPYYLAVAIGMDWER